MNSKVKIAVMVALLSGCGSQPKVSEEFNAAAKMEQLGQYEEAIAYLDQAIAKDPQRTEYKTKKSELQGRLTSSMLQATEALLANGINTTDDATNISNSVQRASQYFPDRADVRALTGRVDKAISDFYATAGEKMDAVESLLAERQWGEAYFELSDLLEVYPDVEGGQETLARIQNQGLPDIVDKAMTALDGEAIPEAIDLLTIAASIKPNDAEVQRLLEEAEGKNNEDYFRAAIEQRLEERNWEKAESLCEGARRFDGMDEYCDDVRNIVDAGKQKQYLDRARQLFEQGKLIGAFDQYELARAVNMPEYAEQMQSFEQELFSQVESIAKRLEKRNQHGLSWVLMERLNRYESRYNEMKDLEDAINNRIIKKIAVYDLSSPSENENAGIIVANNLISDLFRNSSKDLKILERESLKTILEEMKLTEIGVTDSSAVEIGKIHGIDVAIMGSVLRYSVDKSESSSSKSVRVKVGEKIEDNIDYLNWAAVNRNPTPEQLKTAPVPKIKVPQFERIVYQINTQKKVGFVEISFRIVNSKTGETKNAKTLERSKLFEDTANEGVEEANIALDPMDMPTDTEVLKEITQEVVDELVQEVLKDLQNLEIQYLSEGDGYFRRREYNNAVEKYVDAIFDARLKSLTNSPVIVQAEAKIQESLADYRF